MSMYLIGYDLNKGGKNNYAGLIEAIQKLGGGCCHVLESTWLVTNPAKDAVEMAKALMLYLDSTDDLIILQVTSEMAWVRLDAARSGWLNTHNSHACSPPPRVRPASGVYRY